jgi:hypothetical protein
MPEQDTLGTGIDLNRRGVRGNEACACTDASDTVDQQSCTVLDSDFAWESRKYGDATAVKITSPPEKPDSKKGTRSLSLYAVVLIDRSPWVVTAIVQGEGKFHVGQEPRLAIASGGPMFCHIVYSVHLT